MSLSGRIALVTGGSVGNALAQAFLEAGSKVAFVYRSTGREKGLKEAFERYGNAFQSIRADLSNLDEARKATDSTVKNYGRIDFLANSLGGWIGGKRLHEHTDSDLRTMFSIDVVPAFNIMASVLPIMVERKFGRIVNFVSLQVFGTGAGSAVYAASKSAVLALTKAAAEEYKEYGISVNGVAPSIIDTESNRKSMAGADKSKWVGMQEIVDAVLFLCGSGGSLNGTIMKFPGKL